MKATPVILLALLCVTPVHAQSPAPPVMDESILVGTSARASKVIGSNVYRGDTQVGVIKDVLLDLNHATVPAVLIGFGGLLGINEKQIAVPAAMLKIDKEARFTIDLTEDQLKAAPAFDPSKL